MQLSALAQVSMLFNKAPDQSNFMTNTPAGLSNTTPRYSSSSDSNYLMYQFDGMTNDTVTLKRFLRFNIDFGTVKQMNGFRYNFVEYGFSQIGIAFTRLRFVGSNNRVDYTNKDNTSVSSDAFLAFELLNPVHVFKAVTPFWSSGPATVINVVACPVSAPFRYLSIILSDPTTSLQSVAGIRFFIGNCEPSIGTVSTPTPSGWGSLLIPPSGTVVPKDQDADKGIVVKLSGSQTGVVRVRL